MHIRIGPELNITGKVEPLMSNTNTSSNKLSLPSLSLTATPKESKLAPQNTDTAKKSGIEDILGGAAVKVQEGHIHRKSPWE